MKKLILCTLIALTASACTPQHANGYLDFEKERRVETEKKLVQQERSTGNWQAAAFILGIGCVLMLVAGAAIGSKGRRDSLNHE